MPFNFSFWKSSLSTKGSVLIGGNVSGAWLTSNGSSDWAIGTGDFTIEWFQYQTNNGNENFIFNVGLNTIAGSVASGGNRVSVYVGGSRVVNAMASLTLSAWYHVAISRVSGTLSTYFNGSRIDTRANSTNINDSSSSLFIGTQDNTSPFGDNWPGNITNFRWVKGSGLYSGATLSIPTVNLTAVANTKLLLLFENSTSFLTDSSGTGKVVTNGGLSTYSSLSPF